MKSRLIILCLASAAMISCSVGPDYHRPSVDAPGAYKSTANGNESGPAHLATNWWLMFNDEDLNALEDAALKANQDLKAAMARVMEARAAARVVGSQFYPTITLDPSAKRSRTPTFNSTSTGNSVSTTGSTTRTNIQIPFDLSYEVDIWGRVRRAYEASKAQLHASEDDYAVVLQTLQADIAQDYFNLRSFDAQDQILIDNLDLFRKQLALTETQFKVGLAGRTDVLQASTQLDATLAQEEEVRRQRADLEHALAILTGKPPSELALTPRVIETLPPEVPGGLPSDLLGQRPDVAEAEQNLAASSAQIGVAVANFYPKLTLTGAAGFESLTIGSAFDWPNRIWSLGPNLTLPIFEGGQNVANLAQARARYDELLATYRSTILGAFRDVEDSLVDLHMRADEADAQKRAVNSSRELVRLTEIQYRQGLANYLQVIDADRTLLTNQLSAAQTLGQRQVSTVLLIKALGGGWHIGDLPPKPEKTTQ